MAEYSCKLVENDEEMAGGFEVRRQVFVREQGIDEALVYDALDKGALHIIARQGASIVGTARVRLTAGGEAKLERMAVLPPHRRTGLGRAMTSFIMATLKGQQVAKLILHAQHGAIKFYRKCGFRTVGRPFMEAGIRHIKMEKAL